MDDLDGVSGSYHYDAGVIHSDAVVENSFSTDRLDNRYSRSMNAPFMDEIAGVDEYAIDPIVYQRIRYDDGSVEFSQHGDARDFREVSHLNTVVRLLEGVTFELREIYAGTDPKRALYHANTDGLEDNPLIQRRAENEGPLVNGLMTLVVDEEGRLYSLEATAEFETGTELWTLEYDEFDEVTVNEPGWVDDARTPSRRVESRSMSALPARSN